MEKYFIFLHSQSFTKLAQPYSASHKLIGRVGKFSHTSLIVLIEAGMAIVLRIVIVIVVQSFTATPSRSKAIIGMQEKPDTLRSDRNGRINDS